MIFQLALHHLGSLVAGAMLFLSSDVAVYKLVYTALAAWTWEWPMFVTFLVARTYDASTQDGKLGSSTFMAIYCPFILYGTTFMILIYFATRIIEVVFMGMLVAGAVERNATTGPVIGVIMIMTIAVSLQFYSGWIFAVFSMRRRSRLVAGKNMTKEYPSPPMVQELVEGV